MQPFEPNRDAELEAELRDIPLPNGLLGRLRAAALADDEGLDAAVRCVPVPAGFGRRLFGAILEDHEALDAALRAVAVPDGLEARLRRAVLVDDDGIDAVVRDVPVPSQVRKRLAHTAGAAGRFVKWGRLATAASLLLAIGLSYVGAMVLLLASVYPSATPGPPELTTWTLQWANSADQVAIEFPQDPLDGDRPEEDGLPGSSPAGLNIELVQLDKPADLWRPLPADWLGREPVEDWPVEALGSAPEFDGVLQKFDDWQHVPGLVPRGIQLPWVWGSGRAFLLEYGVHPFVAPAAHPVLRTSVVPLGISTTSFERARWHLERGELPFKDDVRTEEFLAAIDYQWPEPRGRSVGLSVAAGPSPFGRGGAQLLQIGVQARRFHDRPRRPATLILTVDASGSMRWGGRLAMVRRAVAGLSEQIGPEDRVALVAFNEHAATLVEDVSPEAADQLAAAAESLAPSGPTNIGNGLAEAFSVARHRIVPPGHAVRVVLLSDGLAGLDRDSAERIETLLGKAAERGLVLDVVDLGQEGPDAQLASFARAGGGESHRATDADQVRWALLEILTGRSQLAAEDVQLRVTFNPKTVLDYRLLGHEKGLIRAPLATDFHVGQTATALYEVRLKKGGGSDVAEVELSWHDPSGRESGTRTIQRTVHRGQFAGALIEAPLSLQAAAVVAQTAELLRESPFAVQPEDARKKPSMDLVRKVAEHLDSRLYENPTFVQFMALVEQAATAKPYRRGGDR